MTGVQTCALPISLRVRDGEYKLQYTGTFLYNIFRVIRVVVIIVITIILCVMRAKKRKEKILDISFTT